MRYKVVGPPGTGKTRRLLKEVHKYDKQGKYGNRYYREFDMQKILPSEFEYDKDCEYDYYHYDNAYDYEAYYYYDHLTGIKGLSL